MLGTTYCSYCGGLHGRAEPDGLIHIGVFYRLRGDLFKALFECCKSEKEALIWVNTFPPLLLSNELFLGNVTVTNLDPGDEDPTIAARLLVWDWRQLSRKGKIWKKGPKIEPVETILLSVA